MATTLLQGHVLDKLAELPAESVQCVVTSPPYWGLRSYGTEPQVWGGDPGHEHEWSVECGAYDLRVQGSKSSSFHGGVGGSLAPQAWERGACACGAWRGELGLEPAPELYVQHMVDVFRAVRRVLRKDGTLWLNLGDSYATADAAFGVKPKDLVGIPWRVAFALQADGWFLRSDVIWHKPNAMPESVTDRPTKAHEHVFLLARGPRYFYDSEAIREVQSGTPGAQSRRRRYERLASEGIRRIPRGEPGDQAQRGICGHDGSGTRNARTVWQIATRPGHAEHFAAMPQELAERCILAGTSARGACSSCGALCARVVHRVGGDAEAQRRPKRTRGMASATSTLSLGGSGSAEWAKRGTVRATVGWAPTCRCESAQIKPCVVLDPFSGTGTTGKAAARLGRDYVGIELHPGHARTAARRLTFIATGPLFGVQVDNNKHEEDDEDDA